MLGAIIGDIVGSHYEVEEINALKNNPDKKRTFEERRRILDKTTPLFTEKCSYTDDSVLTIAIADSLMSGKSFEQSLKEYGVNEIELGLDKYGRSKFGSNFISWIKDEKEGNSIGNGASMRISPIAFFYDSLLYVLKKTHEATIPSHNSTEAIKGAQAVASTIYLSRKDFNKEEIKDFLESRFGYFMNYDLEELQHDYKFYATTDKSVPQAIFCFLESTSFEDCLRKSISIGGDTDTIAAISCSIAESYYGIPTELKKQALSYLPKKYKEIVLNFYKTLELKRILIDLNICNDDFWEYMRPRTKRIDAPLNSGFWGTFIDNKKSQSQNGFKILVPPLTTELSYLINIHEYAHAFELFEMLKNKKDIESINVNNSENYAKSKEEEYLLKKKI